MSSLFEQIRDLNIADGLDALKTATRAAAGASVMDSATDFFESLDALQKLHERCSALIEGHLRTMAQPDK